MAITKDIKKESSWLIASSVFLKLLQFATIVILSRLLQPDDFGLFGLSYAMAEVLAIFGDFGITTFLIYKDDLSKELISSAIWTSLVIGILLMITTILAAPFFAEYFENDMLRKIMYVFSFHILFIIIANIHMAFLQKRMAFKLIAKINTSVLILGSLLSITLAFLGFGIWSFVIPIISNSFLLAVISWSQTKIFPQKTFSFSAFKEIFAYSKYVWMGDVNSIALHNVGLLVIGKYLTIEMLGYFKFALNLVMAVVILFQEANARIFMPLFTHLRQEKEKLSYIVVKLFRYLVILSAPLFILLIMLADTLIPVIFGEKWMPAIPAFQIFCVFGIFAVISRIIPALLNAIGRPALRAVYTGISIPIITILMILLTRYEMLGVAMAYAIANSLFVLLIFGHATRTAEISHLYIIRKTLFLLSPLSIMVTFVFALQNIDYFNTISPFILICLYGIVGLTTYILSFRFLHREAFYNMITPLKDLRR